MDQMHRGAVEQGELRVLNHKEERDLQHKLNMLEKQYRYTRKMLQQRRDSLVKEERKVVMVKVCEPKATVSIAMKEIGEHKDAETSFSRSIQTSDGRRRPSTKPQRHDEGAEAVEQSRSASAPPPSAEATGSLRHRGNIQSNVSLMQMKNIAMIDSISEKEVTRQQQKAQEEAERQRRLQWESLHNRVTSFIERLKEKGNVDKVAP